MRIIRDLDHLLERSAETSAGPGQPLPSQVPGGPMVQLSLFNVDGSRPAA